jgi:hypothetical protein
MTLEKVDSTSVLSIESGRVVVMYRKRQFIGPMAEFCVQIWSPPSRLWLSVNREETSVEHFCISPSKECPKKFEPAGYATGFAPYVLVGDPHYIFKKFEDSKKKPKKGSKKRTPDAKGEDIPKAEPAPKEMTDYDLAILASSKPKFLGAFRCKDQSVGFAIKMARKIMSFDIAQSEGFWTFVSQEPEEEADNYGEEGEERESEGGD